jgi:hypothetical protein
MIIDYDLKGCMEGQKLKNEITGSTKRFPFFKFFEAG